MSVEERIEALEKRVETLESALTEGPPETGRDQYDSYVIKRLAAAEQTVHTNKIRAWYREAGIRNKSKITDRLRHLASQGLMEEVGNWEWRYVGPRQERLGGVDQ